MAQSYPRFREGEAKRMSDIASSFDRRVGKWKWQNRAANALDKWTSSQTGRLGGALQFLDQKVASMGAAIENYVAGRGYQDSFFGETKYRNARGMSTMGGALKALPLKNLTKMYAVNTGFMVGIDALLGKPMSIGTVAHAAWESIPMTLSFELAGGMGMKGMVRATGWGMLGHSLGMGSWGSLGLQLAGSAAMPGLGWGLAGAMIGYEAGKAAYKGYEKLYNMGRSANKTEFETGDRSYQSAAAATMRSRSVAAIQKSHLNLRNMLGNEAQLLMGR